MPKMKDNNGSRMSPPDGAGVKVRMYNTGFGDCFLLAFRAEDQKARYMLIDCGGLDDQRMERVAQDIAQATGDILHIVVLTHEHADHLNGFAYLETAFKETKINDLWLAWTEDKKNLVASALKRLYDRRITALQAAVENLEKAENSLASGLENIRGFESVSNTATALKDDKKILDALRSRSGGKPKRSEDYLTPGGRPLKIPDVKGIKCYVLGPPQNIKSIQKLVYKEEMYRRLEMDEGRLEMDEEGAFMAAAKAASRTGPRKEDQSFESSTPFDNRLAIEKQDAASHKDYKEFFYSHYGYRDSHHGFRDNVKLGPKWRRIDTAWLEAADQLALKINEMKNNTSLVLAFQLTETKPHKVLLFAADAQVGNWLSWGELQWHGAGEEAVSGLDLIKQTVFYKVGQHGSLNATLREKELEMMESPELVAMIPVDEKFAKTRGWRHPEEKLVKRLMEKTNGRVIRSDKIPLHESISMPEESNEKDWRDFLNNLEWDKSEERLWIQFTVQ